MVRGVLIGVISVALFTLTVSCLLTKDFPTPGTLPPQFLLDLIVLPGEQVETTQEATIVVLPSGEEAIFLPGLKEVWFNLTELVPSLQPNEQVQVTIEVMGSDETTLSLMVKLIEGEEIVKEESKEEKVSKREWKPTSITLEVPPTPPSTPTLLFGIKSEGDIDFYIRRLQVNRFSSTTGGIQ